MAADLDPVQVGKTEIEKGNPDQDAYAFLLATVAEALAAGRFRPEYEDAEALAQLLWANVHGLVSLHMTFEHDPWCAWRPIGDLAELAIAAATKPAKRFWKAARLRSTNSSASAT